MNRTEERTVIKAIDKLTDLICHNHAWCNECPLYICKGDGTLIGCTALILIHLRNMMFRRN